jgi:hypothetical protein
MLPFIASAAARTEVIKSAREVNSSGKPSVLDMSGKITLDNVAMKRMDPVPRVVKCL